MEKVIKLERRLCIVNKVPSRFGFININLKTFSYHYIDGNEVNNVLKGGKTLYQNLKPEIPRETGIPSTALVL